MSEADNERLNELGRSILRQNGIILQAHEDYDWMKNEGTTGYAEFYLFKCRNESYSFRAPAF